MPSLPLPRNMTKSFHHHLFPAPRIMLAGVILSLPVSGQQAGTSPVKIFIMAGQSNMQGHCELNPVTTQGTLSVTWTKAATYGGNYGADFVVETSDTLSGSWPPEASAGTVTLSGDSVTYTFPNPLGTRNFARLKVTGP